MFTQRISMDCTQEQYEKYLKAELDKMGYEHEFGSHLPIIVNNLNRENGSCGSAYLGRKTYCGRTYLGKFNADLFLALAAMTDRKIGGYREIITNGEDMRESLKYEDDRYNPFWRKATVSEIMAKRWFVEMNSTRKKAERSPSMIESFNIGALINECDGLRQIIIERGNYRYTITIDPQYYMTNNYKSKQ